MTDLQSCEDRQQTTGNKQLATSGRRQATSEFFVVGGTLSPDAPSYVERPADEELFNRAMAGEFCYILTARQMGKSSLMVRTARRLQAEGVRAAIVDLTTIGTSAVDAWYLDLLTELADELDLSVDPEAWWHAHASQGQVRRFISFLRDVVLTEITEQVVIFIDEIDTTLNLDFSDDFFAAIRAMHNARAQYPVLNRLTFVLIGVATPSDLIKDQTRTPFNIGQAIDLWEFSWADAQVLQAGWSEIESDQRGAILKRIFHWTNGHPYLTQKLCRAVAESTDKRWTDERVDELVESMFLSKDARKEANLRFVRDRILAYPQSRQLLTLYRRVCEGRRLDDDERSLVQNQLKLSGLVRAENGYLRIRNGIYRRVFDLAWVKENTPVNWVPIGAGIALFVALLAVGFLYLQASGLILTPEPPRIVDISAGPSTILTGETVNLVIEASGTDLQFEWTASRGSLSSYTTPSVLYTAPDSPGPDVVTVGVTGKGGSTTRSVTFEIVAPPTPPPTRSPTATPAPTPTATPPPPTPLPGSLVVADFDGCTSADNLGGPMGAAYNAPDLLVETYVQEPGRGCVARLEYNITEWSAFWMKLQDIDLSPYGRLVFDVRADPQPGIPGQMKIELNRAGNQEVSIIYVSGITADWQTMSVNLPNFGPTGYTASLSSFAEMEELVFTFEASHSGTAGVVYLDNIAFRP